MSIARIIIQDIIALCLTILYEESIPAASSSQRHPEGFGPDGRGFSGRTERSSGGEIGEINGFFKETSHVVNIGKGG